MAFTNEEILTKRLVYEEFTRDQSIPEKEIRAATQQGMAGTHRLPSGYGKEGREVIAWLKRNRTPRHRAGRQTVPCGSEINHGIPELITSYGFAVLTRGLRLPFRTR